MKYFPGLYILRVNGEDIPHIGQPMRWNNMLEKCRELQTNIDDQLPVNNTKVTIFLVDKEDVR
tara:strand:+ start:1183 stop:1371 length:189 start_codon:yes stop_codon:yes gene_type:complete